MVRLVGVVVEIPHGNRLQGITVRLPTMAVVRSESGNMCPALSLTYSANQVVPLDEERRWGAHLAQQLLETNLLAVSVNSNKFLPVALDRPFTATARHGCCMVRLVPRPATVRGTESMATTFPGDVRGEVRVNFLALFASKTHISCGIP